MIGPQATRVQVAFFVGEQLRPTHCGRASAMFGLRGYRDPLSQLPRCWGHWLWWRKFTKFTCVVQRWWHGGTQDTGGTGAIGQPTTEDLQTQQSLSETRI